MSVLSDLNIRNKIVLCFFLLLLTFSISSSFTYVNIGQINTASVASNRALTLVARSEHLLTLILEQSNSLRGYVIKGAEEFAKTYEASKQQFDDELNIFAETTIVSEQKEAARRMKAAMTEWRSAIGDKVIALMRDPATQAAAADLTGIKSLGKLRAIQKEMVDMARVRVEIQNAEQRAATSQASMALILGTVAALTLALLSAVVLGRILAAPMVALARAMAALAEGDRTIEVRDVERRDEIGAMAGALLLFKQAAIEKTRFEDDARAQRQAADGERQGHEAVKAKVAAAQALVVTSLGRGLDRLSNGDLTVRLDEPFGGDYEQLRTDFNMAVDKLQATIDVIAGTSEEIRSGAGTMSHASTDLSRRTETQAASLEETAAALGEITATVRRTAEGANHARDIVGGAKIDAERSGDVVRQAVEAMGGIEDSSRAITEIIGVIDEIAFQTNLLALNAGVEAARAGDAGRGFAVVASEVRELAQRSAHSAKKIKTLISASAGQVEQGVSLVKQTGAVLDRVMSQVSEMTRIVSDIAASAREQAVGLDQVNAAVNQMDQVTKQNVVMVEQATATSAGLLGQADELGRLVGAFNIGTRQRGVLNEGRPNTRSGAARPVIRSRAA